MSRYVKYFGPPIAGLVSMGAFLVSIRNPSWLVVWVGCICVTGALVAYRGDDY